MTDETYERLARKRRLQRRRILGWVASGLALGLIAPALLPTPEQLDATPLGALGESLEALLIAAAGLMIAAAGES